MYEDIDLKFPSCKYQLRGKIQCATRWSLLLHCTFIWYTLFETASGKGIYYFWTLKSYVLQRMNWILQTSKTLKANSGKFKRSSVLLQLPQVKAHGSVAPHVKKQGGILLLNPCITIIFSMKWSPLIKKWEQALRLSSWLRVLHTDKIEASIAKQEETPAP